MDIPHVVAGRFRIEREIGKGGMGTVYCATHLGLERPVAVKVLKEEFSTDPEVAERFMREARTMARLRHPRAAMIFDAGRLADGRPFIVMEHVEGVTLAEALARAGNFTPERSVRIASEICEVLAEAHGLGIVHRDLKPSNIMLNDRGVCVLDFGIAKVLVTSADATRTHATTESGLIIGTPRYMSPEQCLGQGIGPASDLYSVGVLIYEMLVGHPPFTDQLPSAVLVKQATAPPPPLLAQRAEVPRPLALVVHALLAKNPTQRPKTAAGARVLLEKSIAREARATAALPIAPFASTIAALNASGRSGTFRAVTICAILAMLSLVMLAWPQREQSAHDADRIGPARRGSQSFTFASDSAMRRPPRVYTDMLSSEGAARIAASASRGPVSQARILQTRRGQAIAAIHDQRQVGSTHLYMMERRGSRYRVTARAPLDVEGFRGASWTAEILDIDGDGYEEVLCTGADARGQRESRRLVLYVPRMRQTYSLSVGPDRREANTIRAMWSPNAMTDMAQPYRAVLRQRALGGVRSL